MEMNSRVKTETIYSNKCIENHLQQKNTEIFGEKGCLQTTNAPVQEESSLVLQI